MCAFSEMGTLCVYVCVSGEGSPPGPIKAQAHRNQRISITAKQGQGARGWVWGVGKGWGRARADGKRTVGTGGAWAEVETTCRA